VNQLSERIAALSPAKRELLLQKLRQRREAESATDAAVAAPARNGQTYEPPRTEVEQILCGLWEKLLGAGAVGINDDFFKIGGQSLLAAQLAARIPEAIGVELPVEQIFQTPTVAALALRVEAGQQAGMQIPLIEPARRDGPLPLSYSQERLWFIHQLNPRSTAYHVPRAIGIEGALDADVLDRAFTEIVRRHEILRTTFPAVDGGPIQAIHAPYAFHIPAVDLSHVAPQDRPRAVREYWHTKGQHPFDLENGPLLRVDLLRFDEREHYLVIVEHHLIHDGWAHQVLLGEIMSLYKAFSQGRPSPLPELPIQFADFASWQRQWLEGPTGDAQLSYWKRQLAGVPPVLRLPLDKPRPAVQATTGDQEFVTIPAALAEQLRTLARGEGVTFFMVLFAALAILLGRYAQSTDVWVGSGFANRRRKEVESLLGMVVNTVVLRADLSGDPTVREFLIRVRDVCLAAYAHQDVPFEKVVQALGPKRSLSYSPLFQVMFSFHDAPAPRFQIPGLKLSEGGLRATSAKFDLNIVAFPWAEQRVGADARDTPKSIAVSWEYAKHLFDRTTILRMSRHYQAILEEMVADPGRRISELPPPTVAEVKQLLANGTGVGAECRTYRCLHDLFDDCAATTPDAVAVVFEDRWLSYGELARRSNALANYLRTLGVGPEIVVGLCLARSLELVVGLLGILKAGGAYLPLDPADPPRRLDHTLSDANVSIVLTQLSLVDRLPTSRLRAVELDSAWDTICRHPASRPITETCPQNLAYVIYTSGSTGRPKGVTVTHACVARLLDVTAALFEPSRADIWTLFHSVAFDFSVWELWGALAHGGRLVIVPYWVSRAPDKFCDLLSYEGVTVLNQTPSAFAPLMRVDEELRPELALRLVIFGGEALNLGELRPWLSRHGDSRPQLVNMYGITETCVHVTYRTIRLDDADGVARSAIGRQLSDLSVYVLDQDMRLVPIGVAGELHVGGAGLARGYLGRAALTAERFVPNPFGNGDRLYRSGDLARWRADGELEFLGRLDHQVKIRGYRIELDEVEAALRQRAGVKDAAVVVRQERGEKRLVAYVAGHGAALPEAAVLRAHLKQSLPDYMVPAVFVASDALPLTLSGKVDRKALPAPEGPSEIAAYVAPRTPSEEVLAGIWAQLLEFERVGVNDNFFELGGHSLLAMRVTARLREAFGIELPLRAVFETPTLAELAAQVEELRQEASGTALPPLRARERPAALALSFAQERLWVLEQIEGLGTAYNIPVVIGLHGGLEIAALEQSLAEVVRRHEVLRTRFGRVDGAPVQVIEPALGLRLAVEDLSGVAARRRPAAARRRLAAIVGTPFDLERGPLLRAVLLRLSAQEHVAIVVMHHIVSDGWSLGILLREIATLYGALVAGRPSPLPELAVQYADYALWQREWLSGAALARQVGYWKERLAGAPAAIDLPCDRPRPAVQSFRGGVRRFALSALATRRLGELARGERATLFMVLLAAFQVVLSRWSGQQDIIVGTPIAGRTQRQSEELIGLFVNMLALRTDLSGDPTFRGLLGRVKEVSLGAYAHQEVPFEKLVAELQPVRDLSRQPLFQVLFALQNVPRERLELPGLTLRRMAGEHVTAKFDLSLHMVETQAELRGAVEYAADLFDGGTIDRLVGHLTTLLEGIAADADLRLSALPLLGEAERHRLLVEWNDTAAGYPSQQCLHDLFAAQAARTPDAVAVIYEERHLSYGELDRRANQLAHHLRSLGVGPEVIVGLCVERSLDMVVGLLGILKAGGAYLPLDPSYPPERLAYMLADAHAAVLIIHQETRQRAAAGAARLIDLDAEREDIAHQPVEPVPSGVAAANPAYVIYTSGSTGKPKGVMVAHRAVVNVLMSMRRMPGLGSGDIMAAVTPLSFDIAGLEIYLPLITGARLIVLPRAVTADGAALRAGLEGGAITVMQATPATWRMVLEAGWQPQRGLKALCGGEALPVDLAAALTAGVSELWNLYGPTETTIWSTASRVEAGKPIRIGRPIANTQLYVLDDGLLPVPIGVTGELYIGGAGLARGYLGRPALTAERFVPSPLSVGERLYRTGDLARWRADGELEFLGRLDHQVKLRGYRIELGEIEAELRGHGSVKDAVVVARQGAAGDKRLVGYVVGRGDGVGPDAEALRSHVKQSLPDYMVPSAFVVIDALPLTPNGKVDRKALPAPEGGAGIVRAAYVAPRTPSEEVLAGIWAPLLELDKVGVNDNFFELGGHSLLAMRVTARLREAFGIELPLRAVFETPTVAELSKSIEEKLRQPAELPRAPVAEESRAKPWFLVN
jgi:amino acid adenylation domain-containing protein